MPVQVVGILRNILNGKNNSRDITAVRRLLGNERFEKCPKLIILLDYLNNSTDEAESVFRLYQNNSDYFEPEDIVNLAWMLYKNGQYSRAYNLAVTLYNTDSCDEIIIPLIKELYLQAPILFSSNEIREIIRNATINDDIYQYWYNREGRLRLSITDLLFNDSPIILKGKADIDSLSKELFDGNSVDDLIIQAELKYRNEEYDNCYGMCRGLEDRTDLTNSDIHNILFIKADCLMEMAARSDNHEQQQEYYNEACEAMERIRTEVEEDYFGSLRRLKTIYGKLDGDHRDEIERIVKILQNAVYDV